MQSNTTNSNENKFQNFLLEGLKSTDSGLGDRSQYIGASDVGQCLKKSYLTKTKGVEYSLKQLMIFQRGHLAEGIVESALKNNPAGVNYQTQVQTHGIGDFSFMKSHLDFVIEWPNELLVIECKSISSPLPNNKPRESWMLQVNLQMRQLKNISAKKVDRAIIVTINVNSGEIGTFEVPYLEAMADLAEQRGMELWTALQEKQEPKGELSDLCGFCDFKSECSTLQCNAAELPVELVEMAKEIKAISALEKKSKEYKSILLEYCKEADVKKASADGITISLVNLKGRESISLDKAKELVDEDTLAEILKKGSDSQYVKIV